MPAEEKFSWTALGLMCAGVIVLCALGTWQMQRLAWKDHILRIINEQPSRDPLNIVLPADELEKAVETGLNLNYRLSHVYGTYDFSKQIRAGLIIRDGQPGQIIYTPLILDDGKALLIRRGWAPSDWQEPPRTEGTPVDALGWLRHQEKPGLFVPDNVPEQDQWFFPDLEEIARTKDIENLYPYILYAEEDGLAEEYPSALGLEKPSNNHLGYALFWYAMAAALVVIYALRFHVKELGKLKSSLKFLQKSNKS